MIVRCALLPFVFMLGVRAQSLQPGSTGADGALTLLTPGNVVLGPPINKSGDNIFHFTSIQIGAGVTVKLSSKASASPIFWLASGPVQIDGIIDLNGDDGGIRTPAIAGAGGYPGGAPRKPGYRPEHFTPNAFLVPLVGGFGGDGGATQGGGAGGGALLIGSSASITVNGAITANGGASQDGIGGGGGAIRLVAPLIDGAAGILSATGGQPGGANGRIRFETLDNRFTGNLNGTPFSEGRPFGLFLPPDPPPSVRVLSIGGNPATTPELSIRQAGRLTVLVEARYIPPGAILELECFPETGPSHAANTTPLLGTFELSRASAELTFPGGLSHCQANANWKPPEKSQAR